ncbi:MAG TPA: aldehyde dehydrogenase family protein [Aestuariivirgaceae bacterium]|nr:aldehyde dehydrogenase family protein [Aestuariivirgaceae bacterium]
MWAAGGSRSTAVIAMGSDSSEKTKDLSPFHAQQLVEKARWAAGSFASYSRGEVLAIAEATAKAAAAESRKYAEWAVEETGFGVAEHKEVKNRLCSIGLFEHYRNENYTDYRIDEEKKIVEIPRPAGVIFALTPSTNPVSSVFYKTILALLTRNAIVISPHPMAKKCCSDAARLMAGAAEKAGAPDGVIQVIDEPALPIIDQIMKSDRIDLILATGGSPMVRAAYSSGNPALGVGPGNVPAYVDETADIAKAAKRIADSKAFDNSILCTNESTVIAHAAVGERLLAELKRQGCHLVSPEERDILSAHLFPMGKFNIPLIGKSAEHIAQSAGIRVPRGTRVLLAPLERIGDDYLLSREKLCPVLGYYEVASREAGFTAARAMVRRQGQGHSAAIHAEDPSVVLRYGAELNVLRIAVNVGNSTGAAGFDTFLAPSMTVGTGFFGRSSVSENVGPQHLVQWVKIAYNKSDQVKFGNFGGLELPRPATRPRPPVGDIDYSFSWAGGTSANAQAQPAGEGGGNDDLRNQIRALIMEELQALQQERR